MTTNDTVTTEYVFDSPSAPGRKQLDHLQVMFDPITTSFLADIGVWSGARCLDIGSGGGSIARWLADRVGPTGEVVAVDIETEQIDVPPEVQVRRHDISTGLPVEGPFDIIHARLVLMHLSEREQILRMLVDALAPGGWIVLGETPNRPQEVLAAPSAADADIAERLLRVGMRAMSDAGMDLEWAYNVEKHLAAAGLTQIRGNEYCPMVSGGDAGALLIGTYVAQVAPLLLEGGMTEDELARYHELTRDPRFRSWPVVRLVTTAGRKPGSDGVN